MAYYYLNQIDKAKFFHEKSISGDVEPIYETQGTNKTVRDMVIDNYEREFQLVTSEGYNFIQNSVLYADKEMIIKKLQSYESLFYLSMKSRKDHKMQQ